ncbi:transcriptional regulator [Achromobacter marplatensis]|jgi:mRNA-degrading endonuclease RelE of RelBE toxin-antitoxin system|uniref:transcriptional regulator n=1 Tax=Achromobacter marplatensis TaxID=470868 RepID=UPI0028E624CE|nr:transcriptional regulator [Achromobacter marplatensis]
MLTVIETEVFSVWAGKVWSDAEREAFVDWIAVNPEAGDVIPGSGGCRKVRWSRSGMGKRGGSRVIYYLRLANGEVVLLIVYAKARFDDLPASFLAKLKESLDV